MSCRYVLIGVNSSQLNHISVYIRRHDSDVFRRTASRRPVCRSENIATNIHQCSELQNPQTQDRRDTSVLLELCVARKKRLATKAIDLDNDLVSQWFH